MALGCHKTDSACIRSFFQGEYENYKGTGLGLALSKELIEIHQGSIDVRSEKWKGTSFEVKLPLGNNHLKTEEMVNTIDSGSLITEDAKYIQQSF